MCPKCIPYSSPKPLVSVVTISGNQWSKNKLKVNVRFTQIFHEKEKGKNQDKGETLRYLVTGSFKCLNFEKLNFPKNHRHPELSTNLFNETASVS